MEFEAEQNVNVPSEYAFRRMTDVEFFTQLARSRGISMDQIEGFTVIRKGCGWHVKGKPGGRQIDHNILVEDYEPEIAFAVSTQHKGVNILVAIEIEQRGKEKCRIYVDLSATAISFTAKLALKAAQLSRNSLQQKFRRSVRRGAQWLENEYQNAG